MDDSDVSSSSSYWCYYCNKRVEVTPTLTCIDCNDGFVELFPDSPPPSPRASDSDNPRFLQVLRLLARDPPPPPPPQRPRNQPDFFTIHFDTSPNNNNNEEDQNEEGGEDQGPNRSRNVVRLRLRDLAANRRDRILDWAEILMGLEDHSINLRLQTEGLDGYEGDPEDYMNAAAYEALLRDLAESDSRRGAPPASEDAILALENLEITSAEESVHCAVCKDGVGVGEAAKKLPCGHGYHKDCIIPWLGTRNTCPVCRYELDTDDSEYEAERRMRVGDGPSSSSSG